MKKLLNICIKHPSKPVIGIFPNNIFEANTSLKPEKVVLDFIIVDCLIYVTYDDGTIEVEGTSLESLSDLSYNVFEDTHYTLRHKVYLNTVKAFVGTRVSTHEADTIEEAKRQVREELEESGVIIEEEAKQYLYSNEDNN